jgi:hypothetical protein
MHWNAETNNPPQDLKVSKSNYTIARMFIKLIHINYNLDTFI